MTKLLTVSLLAASFFLSAGLSYAQERDLQAATVDQRLERLESNFHAFAIAAVRLAQERGEAPEALGRKYGELFADSWPEEVTPASFVQIMHGNWQSVGVSTRILEEKPDKVKAHRSNVFDQTTFEERFGNMGVSYSDVGAFFHGLTQTIAQSRGLEYSEEMDDDGILFTVRRIE